MLNIRSFVFGGVGSGALMLAGLLLAPSVSQAAYIVPSAPVAPGGAAVAPPLTSQLPGTLLASLLAPYLFTTTAGTTSGNLLSAVFRNASGTLDFYYQVSNSANSVTAIARESNTSFLGFAPQVAFRLDGGSLPGGFTNGTPGIIPLTADLDSSATTVGFNFVPTPLGTKIPPGTTSSVLVISTLATAFTAGNAQVIDGGTQTVAAFQPAVDRTPGVPEPGTFVLLGCALIPFAALRRRMSAKSKLS